MIPLVNIPDKSYMFTNCNLLEEFSLSYKPSPIKSKILITNITNMRAMFYRCSSLKSLPDISEWNTEKVTDVSDMLSFSNIISLQDISRWKTNKFNNMCCLFCGCSSLISLPDISKWNTDNVTNMYLMFGYCLSLVYLPDISKWNTVNLTNMDGMFQNCSSLLSLPDISKWNTNKVKYLLGLFNDCSSLVSLPDISNNWPILTEGVIKYSLNNCISLINLPVPYNPGIKKEIYTINNIEEKFSFCGMSKMVYKIDKISGNKIHILNEMFVKRYKDKCRIKYKNKIFPLIEYFPLNEIENKEENILELFLLVIDDISDLSHMFHGCSLLKEFTLSIDVLEELKLKEYEKSKFLIFNNEENNNTNIITYKNDINTLSEKNKFEKELELIENNLVDKSNSILSSIKKEVRDIEEKNFFFDYNKFLQSALNNAYKKQKINLKRLNYMFGGCSSLINLPDISNWNIDNAFNISSMFFECSSLTSLSDLSNWNTKKIGFMNSMFYKCYSLNYLSGISEWNIKNVTHMNKLFYGCRSLLNLPDMSKWNTEKLAYIDSMFYGCSSLKNISGISKWNTTKVTDMSFLFYNCRNLSNLPDISN